MKSSPVQSTALSQPFVFNLFGGPGSGKSTTAAHLFALLKHAGFNAELVTEFAKTLAWEDHALPLACQPYIFGHQLWMMEKLRGKVEAVVTDSPLMLSSVYAQNESRAFHRLVQEKHESFPHRADVFLLRTKPFNPAGRFQANQSEAERLDYAIRNVGMDFTVTVEGDEDAAKMIFDRFRSVIRNPPPPPDKHRFLPTLAGRRLRREHPHIP